MARKTKTSKKTRENSDSEKSDVVKTVEETTTDVTNEVESDLTKEVSDASDTSADAEENAPSEDDAQKLTDADTVEEIAAEATGSDAETDGDSETPTEEPASEDDADATEDTLEDAEPIETTVAGVVPAQAEEKAPPPPPVPPRAPAPAPSATPLVIGGLIAGAAGFLVATFAVPEGWPNPPAEAPATVEVPTVDPETIARVDALSGDLSALAERLDNLPAPSAEVVVPDSVDLTPLLDRLDAIEGETGGLSDALAALEQSAADLSSRVDEIAERPNIVAPDGSAAMEAQLETFRRDLDAVTEAARAEIEEAQARASQIEADAAAAAAEAARNAAMADIRAALESGEPFADALAGLGDVPDALASVANDGVTPMAALQGAFPDAARGALQQVQSVPEDASATDRVASFLRRHTNARSLAPREGDDPDAVLSRAEAALSAGDVDAALAELDALPEDASAALQSWINDARARAAAVAAMNEME